MSTGLLPEQLAVLAGVFKQPAVACATAANLDVDQVEQWLSRIEVFLRANHKRFSGQPFIFRLNRTATGSTEPTVTRVHEDLAGSKPIVVVDWNFLYIRSEHGIARATEACQRTRSGELEVLILGTYAQLITRGSIVEEIDFVDERKGPPMGNWRSRPISDFKKLLSDHIELDVQKEKSFKFWADKSQRILLAEPENTEKIFQRALLNWLDQNVMDRVRIVAENRDFGQDPADILVVTASSSHIIEVKWLGTNKNGKSWPSKRIDEGLEQVRQYLERDSGLACGHLVVYDARSEDKHKNDSGWDARFKHLLCSEPEIVYLESESPSQKATSVVQKARKKGRNA